MSIDSTSDLDVFTSTDDYGTTATVAGVSVTGLFDNEYIDTNQIEGTRPVLICNAADITAASVGSAVTVFDQAFIIRDFEEIDESFTAIILEFDDTEVAATLPTINSFESATDLSVYTDTSDFATVGLVELSTTVNGIFDNNYQDTLGIEGTRPVFICANNDITDVDIGDRIDINNRAYLLRSIETDGTAFSTLILERDETITVTGEVLLINANDSFLINATDSLLIN